MLVIQPIRYRYELLVPAIVSSFVAADQQNRNPSRVKRVKNTQRTTLALNSQLPHMRVACTANIRATRVPKRGPCFLKRENITSNGFLLVLVQFVPPDFELVCVLHVPSSHNRNIASEQYGVKSIALALIQRKLDVRRSSYLRGELPLGGGPICADIRRVVTNRRARSLSKNPQRSAGNQR